MDVFKVDKVISSLFCVGEKKPHVWWDYFEKQLSLEFSIYDMKEGMQVVSNEINLDHFARKSMLTSSK